MNSEQTITKKLQLCLRQEWNLVGDSDA